MENMDAILADLYALRAGLSVISENKDEVAKIQLQTNSMAYKLLDPFYDVVMERYRFRNDNMIGWSDLEPDNPHSRERLELIPASSKEGIAFPPKNGCPFDDDKQKEAYIKNYNYIKETHGAEFEEKLRSTKFKDDYDAELKTTSNQLDSSTKKRLSGIKGSTFRTILGAFMLILGIIASVIWVLSVVSVIALSVNDWVIVGGAAFVIVGLIFFIRGLIDRKDYRHAITNASEYLSSFNEHTAKLLNDTQSTLAKVDSIRAQANQQIQPIQDVCDSIYKTLEKQYGATLDTRDWQYLDLIIYYIETHRAIDLRDALLQLDRERQTQQIVTAVKEATYVISKTIQTEMSALRSAIRSGFSSLQKSINSGFARLQAIGDAQLSVARQQLSETQLSNSLMQKANATSEQLMNDVHFMRTKLLY